MIILVIRAFFQIRRYLLGVESGAFLARFLFDWVFVFLFFFIFFYSNSFPSLQNFDLNAYVNFSTESLKENVFLGIGKLVILAFLWSGILIHILILVTILIKYIKLSSFSEPDINRFVKFVNHEVEQKKWKVAFNMLKSKWPLVKQNSKLLSCLGDTYVGLNKYEEAFGAFNESLEFATDDSLKVSVSLKAADVSHNELKDTDSAIEILDDTLKQSLEETEYQMLEEKKNEILGS